MTKRYIIKFYIDSNNYATYDNIEAFLLHDFSNYGTVQRVDLLDIVDAESGKQLPDEEPEELPF